MKPILATITVTAVFPAGHVPSGMTLPDFAYRAACGICFLETMTFKGRPLTRDETQRHAEFLMDWDQNLAAWERANGSEPSGPVRTAQNVNAVMTVETAATSPIPARIVESPSCDERPRLLFSDPLGGEWCIEDDGPGEHHVCKRDHGKWFLVGTFHELPIAVSFLQKNGCVARGAEV